MTGRTYEIYLPGGSSLQAGAGRQVEGVWEKISPYKNSRRDFTKCTVESYMLQLKNKCGDSCEVRMKRRSFPSHLKLEALKPALQGCVDILCMQNFQMCLPALGYWVMEFVQPPPSWSPVPSPKVDVVCAIPFLPLLNAHCLLARLDSLCSCSGRPSWLQSSSGRITRSLISALFCTRRCRQRQQAVQRDYIQCAVCIS